MNIPHWIRLALGALVVSATVAGCSRSAQSHFDRGNAYLKDGNEKAAVLEYRRASQKDPKFAPARLKLAELYLKQGNGAGALAEYVRAADLLPKDADVQVKAGSLLLRAGQAEEAKAPDDPAEAAPSEEAILTLRENPTMK